jgi:hypothetical protein
MQNVNMVFKSNFDYNHRITEHNRNCMPKNTYCWPVGKNWVKII